MKKEIVSESETEENICTGGCMASNSETPRKVAEEHEKNYFRNFPYNEPLVRDVLMGLKRTGHFYRGNFDLKNAELSEILEDPNVYPPALRSGLRILNLTEGPGIHKYIIGMGLRGDLKAVEASREKIPENTVKKWKVEKNEVYVTIDNMGANTGQLATYIFERKEKKLNLKNKHIHVEAFTYI